jgi:outer membrane lipoprotein-sorting protein
VLFLLSSGGGSFIAMRQSRFRSRLVGLTLLATVLGPRAVLGASIAYDQTVTTGGQVIISKVKIKGQRFRAESQIQGMTSIIIRNPSGTYQYLPDQGMAMRLPGLEAWQEASPGTDDYAAYLAGRQATRLRSDTLQGHRCEVYHFTDPSGIPTTAWVAQDLQFPIRLEQQSPQGLTVAEFRNVQLDAPIPDSAFQLPHGVQVMGMDDLMNVGGLSDLLKGQDQ